MTGDLGMPGVPSRARSGSGSLSDSEEDLSSPAFGVDSPLSEGVLWDCCEVFRGDGNRSAEMALAGLSEVRLHAVRVTERWMANHRSVSSLARRTRGLLQRSGLEVPPLEPGQLIVHHDYCGAGYGHDTLAGVTARTVAAEQVGLTLEATYTAKTFAALMDLAKKRVLGSRVLFINTLSSVPLEGLLGEAPAEVPLHCLALLQGASS